MIRMNRMNFNYVPYSKKFGASVMVLMLLVSFVLVGLPIHILPRAAATTVPILTLSHSDMAEDLPNVMRIHFDDPDLRENDSPRPAMTIAIPSVAAGAERLLIPAQLVDGSWVVYLTSALGDCTGVGSCTANPDDIGALQATLGTCAEVGGSLYGTACGLTAAGEGVVVVAGGAIDLVGVAGPMAYPGASDFADFVANPGLLIPGRANQENEHFVHVASWTDEDVTIRAFGATTTETDEFDGDFKDHSISNDKSSVSPAAKLQLDITAVTMDNDPTAVDTFTIPAATLVHEVIFTSGGVLTVGGLDATTTDLTYEEDGVNDQTFSIDTPFDMATLEQGATLVTTATTTSWANGDDYRIEFPVGDGSGNDEGETLSISLAQGTLSLDASAFTFRSPMTITVTDNDRNLDSTSKDSFLIDVIPNTPIGQNLIGFGGDEVFDDTAACGPCTLDTFFTIGEPAYDDVDSSGTVTASDIRIFNAVNADGGPYADGSVVLGGDGDVGNPLIAFGTEVHEESTFDGAFTVAAAEGVYTDLDGDSMISPGDMRLANSAPFGDGTVVLAGDSDIATASTLTTTAKETGNDDGIFEADLEASIGAFTILPIGGDEVNVMPGDHPDFTWRYADPYSTNIPPGNTASDSAGLLTTQAAMALDKTGYGPQEATAVLTITEPDANDDDGDRESLTLQSFSGTAGTAVHDESGVTIADFEVTRIRNAIETIRAFGPGITREDADDDGFWTIDIDLQSGDLDLESGDVLQVCYNDLFDDAEVCASASIGGSVAQISFDRPVGSIPIAPGQTVSTRISVLEDDENRNPNDIETFDVRIIPLDVNGDTVGLAPPFDWFEVPVTETGPNTANFETVVDLTWGMTNPALVTITFESTVTAQLGDETLTAGLGPGFSFADTQNMIGGTLRVEVIDGLGPEELSLPTDTAPLGDLPPVFRGVSGEISIQSNDAFMTINFPPDPLGARKMGTPVEVTLIEEDMNSDTQAIDTVIVEMHLLQGGTVLDDTLELELTETGLDTFEFMGSGVIGTGTGDFASQLVGGACDVICSGQTMRFRYVDGASAASFGLGAGLSERNVDASFLIDPTTAVLSTVPDAESGPFNVIEAQVLDIDLAVIDPTTLFLTNIIALESGDSMTVAADAVTSTPSTGTFLFDFPVTLVPPGGPADPLTLEVEAVDEIHIFYVDNDDGNGDVLVFEHIIAVNTMTGVVDTDSDVYNVGDFIEISVSDIDQNQDSTRREPLTSGTGAALVRVTTDSWQVGSNVILLEVARGSGDFVTRVEIINPVEVPAPGEHRVIGRIGDTITVTYTDPLGDDGEETEVVVTARIGTRIPKTQQVPADPPEIVDQNNQPIPDPSVGDVLIQQARVTNNDTVAHTFTFLIQDQDSNGQVINLAWVRDLTLQPGDSVTPGLAWIPSQPGVYEKCVFVWESIDDPIALSPVQCITFTVSP